ncbi:hypothetical protein PHYBOEH_008994 [Phytophthora boehmeriae]|uniref:Uncharacterized protein n=1 Tax=Phytophthora boehmeriae TaxID=109152 RepID=A0A8T1W0T8_9STRA|nr:hypothetical protein PHYBOEH_008994 [Phytophthora boehmeriae]
MGLIKTTTPVVLLLSTVTFVQAFTGSLIFYNDTNFDGITYRTEVNATQLCYNLSCFSNMAGSVKWENLPTAGNFDGKARVAFYTSPSCAGSYRDWPTDTQERNIFPSDFKLDGIFHLVASVMIMETNSIVLDVVSTSCKISM